MQIVIADDSRPTRFFFERVLQDLGHEVVGVAVNGVEAIELCQKHKPDLVILDNTMTGGNGTPAAMRIFDEKLAKRVIMISLGANSPSFHPIRERGITILKKPCSEVQIVNAVQGLLVGP